MARGNASIAISGGTHPKAIFALLAETQRQYREQIPWEKLELYWVDERCVPPDHPDSNYRMTGGSAAGQSALERNPDLSHPGRARSGRGCGQV